MTVLVDRAEAELASYTEYATQQVAEGHKTAPVLTVYATNHRRRIGLWMPDETYLVQVLEPAVRMWRQDYTEREGPPPPLEQVYVSVDSLQSKLPSGGQLPGRYDLINAYFSGNPDVYEVLAVHGMSADGLEVSAFQRYHRNGAAMVLDGEPDVTEHSPTDWSRGSMRQGLAAAMGLTL